jgi:hypothetical protein
VETEMMNDNRNVCSDLDRRIRWMQADPWHPEHSPCENRFNGSLPRGFATTKQCTIVVYVVSLWQNCGRGSNL